MTRAFRAAGDPEGTAQILHDRDRLTPGTVDIAPRTGPSVAHPALAAEDGLPRDHTSPSGLAAAESEAIGEGEQAERTRFFTICTASYFPGTVAMLNSLRLTGNRGEIVILDRGLVPWQRRVLEQHATVVDIPATSSGHPTRLKAYPHLFGYTGLIVFIDSDMIVTRSLGP
ncbi:MAG: hypothetical protein ACREA0_12910, partial [bacterium]